MNKKYLTILSAVLTTLLFFTVNTLLDITGGDGGGGGGGGGGGVNNASGVHPVVLDTTILPCLGQVHTVHILFLDNSASF